MEENSRARPITESKQALTLGMLTETNPGMKYRRSSHNIDQEQNIQVQIKNVSIIKKFQLNHLLESKSQ